MFIWKKGSDSEPENVDYSVWYIEVPQTARTNTLHQSLHEEQGPPGSSSPRHVHGDCPNFLDLGSSQQIWSRKAWSEAPLVSSPAKSRDARHAHSTSATARLQRLSW